VLKTQGFVREAGRGLSVVPLDPKLFEVIYVISTYPPLHLREAINRCRMDIERLPPGDWGKSVRCFWIQASQTRPFAKQCLL
jgi:hypothetical protein